MSNLQNELQALQPYLVGIRYMDNIPIVEAVFKEGWVLPEHKNIQRIKAENESNHFMLFSQVKGVGLDDLLKYLETIIKLNIEREKKVELLKIKVQELKDIFLKNSLSKLQKLKFSFTDDELIDDIENLTIEDPQQLQQEIDAHQEPKPVIQELIEEPVYQQQEPIQNNQELTEEELEILEEERRAENFKNWKEKEGVNKKLKKIGSKIELPPKKIAKEIELLEADCECGPEEACSKCIHLKDL